MTERERKLVQVLRCTVLLTTEVITMALPEAAALGLAAWAGVGLGVVGETTVGVNSTLLATVGAIGTTCTVASGCGPSK